MKRILAWFGYVPVSHVYRAHDSAGEAVRDLGAELVRVRWDAERAADRAARVEAGHALVIGQLLEELASRQAAKR